MNKKLDVRVRMVCPTCIDSIPDFWYGTLRNWMKELAKMKRTRKDPSWFVDGCAHEYSHNYNKNHKIEIITLGKRKTRKSADLPKLSEENI